MTLIVAPIRPGDWLKSEEPSRLSRITDTVLSGQTLKAGQVCCTDLSSGKRKAVPATGNEVHTYTFTGTPTAGTFTLKVWHKDGYWVETSPLTFDDTTADVDAALEAVLGTSAVVAVATGSGSAITAITITFSGTNYASTVQPLGQAIWDGVTGWTACAVTRSTSAGVSQNEVQTVAFGAAATAGTVKLGIRVPTTGMEVEDWPLVWTDAIAWSATDATYLSNINAALDNVLGSSKVVATAIAATDTDLGFVLTFSGSGYSGIKHPFVEVDASALTSVTTVTVTRTTAGGAAGNRYGATADCISVNEVDASAGDVSNAVFIARDALVNGDALYWGGCDPTAGALALKKVGIIVRSGPTIQEHQV